MSVIIEEIIMSKKLHADIMNEIMSVGHDIVFSHRFCQCLNHPHHFHTTVGAHTINVAIKALLICYWLDKHCVQTDHTRMIFAALGHDLAMPHTKRLYGKKAAFITAWGHPIDSAKIANDLVDIHTKTAKAIKRHMWPLCIIPPTSLEGWVLTIADKWAAIQEIVQRRSRKCAMS